MKYIVAVSGGVDSAVLLDMLAKANEHELVVAHFDHGIREDSASDARFVEGLAGQYGLQFELGHGELGKHASEEEARDRRYAFLRGVADREGARIVTAHHADDVIETIAINLTRGTGWRGLAVLGDQSLVRPLLSTRKSELYEYALANKLEWVEDETNQTTAYLRNRLRRKLGALSEQSKHELLNLCGRQFALTEMIDAECKRHATNSRYFLTMIDDASALELLRWILAAESISLTRPQRQRLRHAIQTALPGSTFEAGSGAKIGFTLREFIVKHPL